MNKKKNITDMTRKKGNMCTNCGVRHSAPTGKKCAYVKEVEDSTVKSQGGTVSNGLQASPQVLPNAVDADRLAPAVQVEERIDVVERSVTQMKTMMSQVLRAVGVKETDQELTESQVELSSEDDGFVQVRSRRKKKSNRTHKKHRRTHSTSASSVTSASKTEEGNTKQYAQKRFLAKDVKAKSVEDILLIGVKSIEKALTEKCDPLPVVRHVKFLAEKATKRMFEPVAFIKYDEAVRKRVNETGITQFRVIETDEVYSHLSIENTVKVTGKSSTSVKGGRGTTRAGSNVNKSNTHCIRFNNYDGGCKGHCSYLHACYVCESKDHGKRDCPKKVNK